MTLKDFLSHHDNKDSIIILAGKRKVAKEDEEKLVQLGRLLAMQTKNALFRSGNADGADYLFSSGIADIDKSLLQVITPWAGHRRKYELTDDVIPLESIDLSREPEVIMQSKLHTRTAGLIDPFLKGEKGSNYMAAAYIIRDTVMVIGSEELAPATYGIFYDDLNQPEQGGTGHTLKTCRRNNLPVIDQRTWMEWLDAQ
ncbi:MAG: hypothetical protein IPM69_11865 [Ignavibacteria bacterium]|nr:hypothetical protein [Ignavibacteria bacterium]